MGFDVGRQTYGGFFISLGNGSVLGDKHVVFGEVGGIVQLTHRVTVDINDVGGEGLGGGGEGCGEEGDG